MQAANPLVAWRGTKSHCGRAGPHQAGGHTLFQAANLSLGAGGFVLPTEGLSPLCLTTEGPFGEGEPWQWASCALTMHG